MTKKKLPAFSTRPKRRTVLGEGYLVLSAEGERPQTFASLMRTRHPSTRLQMVALRWCDFPTDTKIRLIAEEL